MRKLVLVLILGVVLIGAAAAAVGLRTGSGQTNGKVELAVTRDFGAQPVGQQHGAKAAPADDTIMRLLESSYAVKTRYGGGFVQEIEGLAGGREDARPIDWFFYVNGIESSVGAAERKVTPGDRIWWDRHHWEAAQRIPAVVGSFPEPFLAGSEGRRIPTKIVCLGPVDRSCQEVETRLTAAGATGLGRSTVMQGSGPGVLRVIVGRWSDVRTDPTAQALERGPRASGVFARFDPAGRQLQLLDQDGQVVRTVGAGAGLVAATAQSDEQPTWLVTGTDEVGVAAAAAALEEDRLRNHFALAIENGTGTPLPTAERGQQ